ncbi:MAG: septum formation initiator family protein [Chloroflexi bacterium]|nr:septum formation initiator family protein [Chloroflexota bacterium]
MQTLHSARGLLARRRVTHSVLIRRRLIAILAGITAVYLAVLSGQRALDGYRARQQVVAAANEIETLRRNNLAVQAELNDALRDSEIERVGRNELGLVKPGDRPVILIWPEGSMIPPAEPRTRAAPVTRANWKAWLRLFFDSD